jgi:hypothetical protein
LNPLHIFRLVALLTACGAEAMRGQEIQFDIRRIPVGHRTSDVVVLDLDGDGSLDVAVSGGGEVTVLLGDSTGALQIHERVEAGRRPVDISLGDLDGDGRLDMAVANHETTYVTLLFQGPAGFASGRRRKVYRPGYLTLIRPTVELRRPRRSTGVSIRSRLMIRSR